MAKLKNNKKKKKSIGDSQKDSNKLLNSINKNAVQNEISGIKMKNDGSILITFSVKPNARRDHIYFEENQLCLDIIAVPVKGKANLAIIKYLSERFHIPKSSIFLIRGQTSHQKTFHLQNTDLSPEKLEKLILNEL